MAQDEPSQHRHTTSYQRASASPVIEAPTGSLRHPRLSFSGWPSPISGRGHVDADHHRPFEPGWSRHDEPKDAITPDTEYVNRRPHGRIKTRSRKPRRGAPKRPRTQGDSDGEYVPRKKYRLLAQNSGARIPKPRRCTSKPPIADGDQQQAGRATKKSYQEWPLINAKPQCVIEEGLETLHIQSPRSTPCVDHSPQDQAATARYCPPQREVQGRQRPTKEEIQEAPIESNEANGLDGYPVKHLLARWKEDIFLVRWADDSTDWVRRSDIDPVMVAEFEESYKGFDQGIDILRSRIRAGKRQYRLRWHGRPTTEGKWVDKRLMRPGTV